MAASTNADIGLGATIAVNDGSGGAGSAYGVIVDVLSISPFDPTVGIVERKPLNLANRTILKKPALKDPGDFQFQYEFSKGQKDRLDALVGTERMFQISLPDVGDGAYTKTIAGIIVHNSIDAVVSDGIMTATCAVAASGVAS